MKTNNSQKLVKYQVASRKHYTYSYLKGASMGKAETVPELAQFAADVLLDLQNDPKIVSYKKFVLGTSVDRQWVKVTLIKGTPTNIKDAIRNYLIKSNYTFAGKPYEWSPSNRYNRKECYLAIGPRSKNCGYTLGGSTSLGTRIYLTKN